MRLSINNVVREAIVPAAVGGVGALGLDVVMGYLNPYLPASLQSTTGAFNALNLLVKVAGAVGLGMVAGKFMGASRGKTVMIGALTVTAYSAIRNFTAGSGIPGLSGYSDYTPYPMGAYMRGPTGTPGIQGLGYVSPGAVIAPTLTPKLGAYMARPMNVASPLGGDYGDGM